MSKDLFWLMVLEVFIHGWLDPLLWAQCETGYHGGKTVLEGLLLPYDNPKWKEATGRNQGRICPSKAFLP